MPPVQHARKMVPIKRKAAIKEAMVIQDILEPQIEPTPWVSSVTYPVKPIGEVRPCLDLSDLNKAIISENHKPQTVEEIAQLAGQWSSQRQMPSRPFYSYTSLRQAVNCWSSTLPREVLVQEDAIWSQMCQDVFQMKMDLIMEKCPGVISIHDDTYSTSKEDQMSTS